jgi:shikimate 5-dehydrogenase
MECYKHPPALYMNRNCTEEALDDLLREPGLRRALVVTDKAMVALGFAGANVTTPHKLAVAKLVETGAQSVNTLVVGDRRVLGFSTDAAILSGLETRRPAILGDGGSATAFATTSVRSSGRVVTRRRRSSSATRDSTRTT